MTDGPILSITDLSVRLPGGGDRAHAVEGLTLDVQPGEIVCVVGESGSGKSVTSQAVMGLLPKGQLTRSAGRIVLQGEDISNAPADRLRDLRGTKMAMIFQEPMTALNPVMTCGDQIDEVLAIHTKLSAPERKAKVLDIMRATKLPDVEQLYDSYPHQLSGGQRQRVMIASALVLDPALLIADEPTTALDVTTQKQILALIKEMQQRRGTGVLFITHDFGVVVEIADRVAVMRYGKLVETGTVDEVLNNPREDYTKMLIGSVPSLEPPPRAPITEGPIALRTQKLDKTYSGAGLFKTGRTVKAAQAVDIEIRRGETLGIVGESGSGKSTVARCIARLIDPTDGQVLVGGVDIARMGQGALRPYRRKVQIVFQDPYRSLNPRRTVAASMVEGPVNFGLGGAEALKRAADLMGLVGLKPDALERYPHQFSGGQRQRICIARALMMEPELLIADEAVSALDVSVQAQVLKLLDDVRQRFNLAVLFITHDLRVAAQVCDRIAVMQRGVVVEQGYTADIYAHPAHDYTKALFAAAPGKGFGVRIA
jgi:peptide/nickel transport system ATP-binding protein